MSELDLVQEFERLEGIVQVYRVCTLVFFTALVLCFILALVFTQYFGEMVIAGMFCTIFAASYSACWHYYTMEVLFLIEAAAKISWDDAG